MRLPSLRTFLALALPCALAGPAAAQNAVLMSRPCHDSAETARQLVEEHREAVAAAGVETNGNLLELYVAEATGVWTIVSTVPGGASCIVATGRGWGAAGTPAPADEPS